MSGCERMIGGVCLALALMLWPGATAAQDSEVVIIDDTVEEVIVVDGGGAGGAGGGGEVDVLRIPAWMYEHIGNWWQNLPDFPSWPPTFGPGGNDQPEEEPDCEALTEELKEVMEVVKMGVFDLNLLNEPGAGISILVQRSGGVQFMEYDATDVVFQKVAEDVSRITREHSDRMMDILAEMEAGGCMGDEGRP